MKTHQGPPLSQPINRKLQRVTNVMVQLENVTRLLHVLIFSHVCLDYIYFIYITMITHLIY